MKPTILALDLEGTLISNAISQIPRPGLYPFLEDVHGHFDQLMIFTTVPEDRFRSIAALLVREENAPRWFAEQRYVNWKGKTKDLLLASPQLGSALLLDDHGPMFIRVRSIFGFRSLCLGHPTPQTTTDSA